MEECKTFSELRLLIQYVDELLAKCDQIHQLWRFAASIALITLCFNTVTRIAKMRKFLNPAALFANKNKQQASQVCLYLAKTASSWSKYLSSTNLPANPIISPLHQQTCTPIQSRLHHFIDYCRTLSRHLSAPSAPPWCSSDSRDLFTLDQKPAWQSLTA